jgi:hypothetical protein
MQIVLAVMCGLVVGGLARFGYEHLRRRQFLKGRLVVGDTVAVIDGWHEMVGEVTRVGAEPLAIWVRWENDATCNYTRDELKRVKAAQTGTWLGDCGEQGCDGVHNVHAVERHGGRRCVAFTCGEHRIRQSERWFLAAFKRIG